jgi:hypothetical protein
MGDPGGSHGLLRRLRRRAERFRTDNKPTDAAGSPIDLARVPLAFWWLPAAGLLPVLLYSLAQGVLTVRCLVTFSVGTASSAAALLVGAVLGFLFGYPQPVPTDAGAPRKSAAYFALNTNLAQVSDWLTKILIGIGLVQLGVLATRVGDLGRFIGAQMGTRSGGDAIGTAIVVYFVLAGLLLGYLWTALSLGTELEKSRRSLEPPPPPPEWDAVEAPPTSPDDTTAARSSGLPPMP